MKQTMKRAFCLILLFSLLFNAIPIVNVYASSNTNSDALIQIQNISSQSGATVELDISVINNPGIYSIEFKVAFDDTYLTLSEVRYNTEFGGSGMAPPLNNNFIVSWFNSTEVKDITKDGVLLTLTFNVDEDAPEGTFLPVSVVSGSEECFNADDIEIPFAFSNGGVNVLTPIPGDINGDRKVTTRDVTRLHQYVVGSPVEVDTKAIDTNGDGKVTTRDVTRLHQYVVGCPVDLYYDGILHVRCQHTSLTAVPAKDANCTEDGNHAYWDCDNCDKLFSDAEGKKEITLAETVIAKGHTYSTDWFYDANYHWHASTCEHNNLVNDKAEHSYGNDNICDICLAANTPNPTKPYKITYELYEYDENKGDTYLPTAYINNSLNPTYYSSTDSFDLENPTCAGYEFLGWFTIDGEQITHIDAGTNKNLRLQARWKPHTYKVVYRMFKTPLEDTIKEKYKTFTVKEGLVDMPNPEIYNYVFLGWYTDDGVEVTNIPIGTTNDVILNAHFVSRRNLAKPVEKLEDPIIIEDSGKGTIYFAYELGTIEHVPLDELWRVDSLHGLSSQVGKEYTWSIETDFTNTISETIQKATVDSGTWSVSENWADSFNVDETWAQEHGMTRDEMKEALKTTTDGYSLTYSKGGQKGTSTTDGTTTINYDSKEETDMEASKVTAEMGVNVKSSFIAADVEIDTNLSGSNENKSETKTHSGTDTTDVDTKVVEKQASWNKDSSKEHIEQISTSESIRNVLSETISETKKYGQSYSKGGAGSQSFDYSTSENETSGSQSTFTYSNVESQTISSHHGTNGTFEGSYREVMAGTIHVFGIVMYDVATNSYSQFTYNVLDDEVKNWLDYSPDGEFNDYEYSVLPFEVPYFVHEYVSSKIAVTEGVRYQTSSTTGTAKILEYAGSSTDVLLPTYISAGGTAYKVTEISPNAFAGNTSIKTVILSEYIDEIPDEAFKGCTSLEEISGFYSIIGDEAFSGCGELNSFSISSTVSKIGEKAFDGVKKINVTVLNADSAIAIAESRAALVATENEIIADAQAFTQELVNAAVNSGADTIILDISHIISGTKLNIEIPEITYFELNGGKKTYTDLAMVSSAQTTKLSELIINNSSSYSLDVKSEEVLLNAVSVTSTGTSLALSCDGAIVSLYKDTRLISNSATAIVCKNATFSSHTVDDVIGTLDVSGNIYVVGESGNVKENTCPYFVTVTNGEIIAIEEDQFDGFAKGMHTVTFNPNGGKFEYDPAATGWEYVTAYGEALGNPPKVGREGFEFIGWFDENGVQIDSETIINEDVTVKAYWLSDFVLADTAPAGAEIEAEKWTYDLTTTIESDQAAVDGYILINSKWSNYGEWSDWTATEIIESESRIVETKTVTDKKGYTEYSYGWYINKVAIGSHAAYSITHYCATCAANYYGTSTSAWIYENEYDSNWNTVWTNTKREQVGTWSCNCGKSGVTYSDPWNGHYRYIENSRYVEPVTHIEYRYADRKLIYTHSKTESCESIIEITETENISNIQKWVKYIVK